MYRCCGVPVSHHTGSEQHRYRRHTVQVPQRYRCRDRPTATAVPAPCRAGPAALPLSHRTALPLSRCHAWRPCPRPGVTRGGPAAAGCWADPARRRGSASPCPPMPPQPRSRRPARCQPGPGRDHGCSGRGRTPRHSAGDTHGGGDPGRGVWDTYGGGDGADPTPTPVPAPSRADLQRRPRAGSGGAASGYIVSTGGAGPGPRVASNQRRRRRVQPRVASNRRRRRFRPARRVQSAAAPLRRGGRKRRTGGSGARCRRGPWRTPRRAPRMTSTSGSRPSWRCWPSWEVGTAGAPCPVPGAAVEGGSQRAGPGFAPCNAPPVGPLR